MTIPSIVTIAFVLLAVALLCIFLWPRQVARITRGLRFTYVIGKGTVARGDINVLRIRVVAASMLIAVVASLLAAQLAPQSTSHAAFKTYDNGAVSYADAADAMLPGKAIPFRTASRFPSTQSTPIFVFFSNRALASRTFSWRWLVDGKLHKDGAGSVDTREPYVALAPSETGFQVGDHEVQFFDDKGQPLVTVYFRVVEDGLNISK